MGCFNYLGTIFLAGKVAAALHRLPVSAENKIHPGNHKVEKIHYYECIFFVCEDAGVTECAVLVVVFLCTCALVRM